MNSYFSHDSNARNDEKIIRLRMMHGVAGYGVYFMLLERMREEENYMIALDYAMIAFDFRVDEKLIKSVVEDFGLFNFTEDKKYFYSDSFKNRMLHKDEIRRNYTEAGKKGAIKRWKNDSKAIATPCENDSNKSKVKERKEKKRKENNILSPLREREGTSAEAAVTPSHSPQGISFDKFKLWLEKNAPEILELKPPTEAQWAEVKIVYQNPRNLGKACQEIAANPAFLKKWRYFHVSLLKWFERANNMNITHSPIIDFV